MRNPQEIQLLKGASGPEQYPPESLPEVAIAGRSNVGKSSLINALVGRKRLARTSRTPGKTQCIHFYRVDNRFVLVDLPGYGYARVSDETRQRWRPMVERYLTSRRTLCMVATLMDLRRIPNEQDLQLRDWLASYGIDYIVVLNKVDKLPRGRRLSQIRRIAAAFDLPSESLHLFSAVTKEGRRRLWGLILQKVEDTRMGRVE